MFRITFVLEATAGGLESRVSARQAITSQCRGIDGIVVQDPSIEQGEYRTRNPICDLVLLSAGVGAAYHAARLARRVLARRNMRMTMLSPKLPPCELPAASDEEVLAWLKMVDQEAERRE